MKSTTFTDAEPADTTNQTNPRPHSGDRALVLGGGGSAGNAWIIGVIAGLLEAGVDVARADLVIGTSAGATTAAQITSASAPELLDATLAPPPPRPPAASPGHGPVPVRPVTNHDHVDRLRTIIAAASDVADMRRRLGATALSQEAASDGSWPSRWRTMVASRLPSQHWPQQKMLITAVNAQTGAPVVFERGSGVDLADAVAASCSSSLPYRINGTPYIDGGYRSNAENADLAAGCARVLVLSPFSGRSLQPPEWGTHLASQIDDLRAHGSQVETIFPDESTRHIFGPGGNVMDPSSRALAAQTGVQQGRALATRLSAFW